MSPQQLRAAARLVLALPVGEQETVSHILARLWSAGTIESRDLRARYMREEGWNGKFFDSLKAHQIPCQGISNFGLPVTLLASDNTYLQYPVQGVIVILEHGMNLTIIKAVFHRQQDDGSLGAPVSVPNARFEYGGY